MENLKIEEDKLLEIEEELEILKSFCEDEEEIRKFKEKYLRQKKKVEQLKNQI